MSSRFETLKFYATGMVPFTLFLSGVTYYTSKEVEPSKRGPFLTRFTENFGAFIFADFQIDSHKDHFQLTTTLSSKEYANSGKAKKEAKKYTKLFSDGQGALFKAVEEDFRATRDTLVFRRCPKDDKSSFSFSGKSSSVFDSTSRNKIPWNFYSHCRVEVLDDTQKSTWYSFIVINDNSNPNSCQQVSDLFIAAAKINATHKD